MNVWIGVVLVRMYCHFGSLHLLYLYWRWYSNDDVSPIEVVAVASVVD